MYYETELSSLYSCISWASSDISAACKQLRLLSEGQYSFSNSSLNLFSISLMRLFICFTQRVHRKPLIFEYNKAATNINMATHEMEISLKFLKDFCKIIDELTFRKVPSLCQKMARVIHTPNFISHHYNNGKFSEAGKK